MQIAVFGYLHCFACRVAAYEIGIQHSIKIKGMQYVRKEDGYY